jgi:hypothetical protein
MNHNPKQDGAPPEPPRVGHLDSLNGILREMGAVYREMRRGELDVTTGAKLVYTLRCLRETIEGIILERLDGRLSEATERAIERASERRSEPSGPRLQ